MNKTWILAGAILLVAGFQNCGNANFSAVGELVAKPDGTGTETALIDDGGTTNLPTDGLTPQIPTEPTVPPTTYPPRADRDRDRDREYEDDDHDRDRHEDDDHDDDRDYAHENDGHDDDRDYAHEDSDGGDKLQYVCVLKGNGKSTKIALTNTGLNGKVGTPQDVCMSENACLKIISEKFDVRSAEKRGFCNGKNKSVVTMTDLEIEASLVQAKLIELLAQNK